MDGFTTVSVDGHPLINVSLRNMVMLAGKAAQSARRPPAGLLPGLKKDKVKVMMKVNGIDFVDQNKQTVYW